MNIWKPPFKKIAPTFPYILFAIAVLGFIAAYTVFSLQFAVNSLIYLVPIVLVAIILMVGRKRAIFSVFARDINIGKRLSLLPLVLATVLLFVISLIVLLSNETRPWSYFIIIALISGFIFIQILTERQKWTNYLILFEIGLLSLNLIWGVTLKYPLYFGATDIFGHLFGIETVLQTAHTAGLETYVNFPAFHIFNAIGIEITGLSLRTGLFLFMGIAWETGMLFAYLLFLKISNSTRFSLTSCLIWAITSQFILYGMYAITRSLAFVIILCWVYLILNKNNFKYIFLSIVTMAALILTHHTTILLSIPILLVIYISQRRFAGNRPGKWGLTFLPIMILTICFGLYLFYIAGGFTSMVIQTNWAQIIHPAIEPGIGPQNLSHYIMGDIADSLFLFFALLGIGMAIRQYALGNKRLNFIIIGLPSLFFLLFYFSNITGLIPDASRLYFYRIPLLVSPFIALMTVYGLNYFINLGRNTGQFKSKLYLPILATIVIVITFFSLITSSVANDISYVQHSADVGSAYFTNSELTVFSFIREKCNYDSKIYGDYQTARDEYDLPFFDRRFIQGADLNYINEGYLVLRTGELQKSGGLDFSLDRYGDSIYRYHVSNSEINIQESLLSKDCVYSDGSVQSYIFNNGALTN